MNLKWARVVEIQNIILPSKPYYVRRYLRTFEGTCKTVSLNRKENNSRERITLSIFPGSRFPKSNWKLVTEIRHEASYEVTFEGTFGTI